MTDIKSLIDRAENWERTTEFIANPWIEELIAALRDATDERLAALQSYVSASETIDRLAAENAKLWAVVDFCRQIDGSQQLNNLIAALPDRQT